DRARLYRARPRRDEGEHHAGRSASRHEASAAFTARQTIRPRRRIDGGPLMNRSMILKAVASMPLRAFGVLSIASAAFFAGCAAPPSDEPWAAPAPLSTATDTIGDTTGAGAPQQQTSPSLQDTPFTGPMEPDPQPSPWKHPPPPNPYHAYERVCDPQPSPWT